MKRRRDFGQAYIELVMVLPIMLIVIAALIFFGRVLYVKIALDMASYDACRAAVEALDPSAGAAQGFVAGRQTLAGFDLQLAGAAISVAPQGAWDRGTPVMCAASYNVFVGDVPFVGLFHSGRGVALESSVWSRVETWRSDWK
ncbi:MAG: pilus assembly protein [Chloroflexi bacterium]|nr:pilus assembly protein [Chloroflexota bacterium]